MQVQRSSPKSLSPLPNCSFRCHHAWQSRSATIKRRPFPVCTNTFGTSLQCHRARTRCESMCRAACAIIIIMCFVSHGPRATQQQHIAALARAENMFWGTKLNRGGVRCCIYLARHELYVREELLCVCVCNSWGGAPGWAVWGWNRTLDHSAKPIGPKFTTRARARGLISVRMGHYAGLCQMTRVALLCCAGGNVILHISTMRRCDARGCQKMGRHIIAANWLFVWRGTRKLRSAVS